jgi:hypothetical protein
MSSLYSFLGILFVFLTVDHYRCLPLIQAYISVARSIENALLILITNVITITTM